MHILIPILGRLQQLLLLGGVGGGGMCAHSESILGRLQQLPLLLGCCFLRWGGGGVVCTF